MKNKLLLFGVTSLLWTVTSAQEQKIGYANVDFILGNMPETEQIRVDVQAYDKQLADDFKAKYDSLQMKVKDFEARAAPITEDEKQKEQTALLQMQNDLQKYQQNAPTLLEIRSRELLKPAYEKIYQTLETVRKELGYAFIFHDNASGAQVILAADPAYDVSLKVLEKMGLIPILMC